MTKTSLTCKICDSSALGNIGNIQGYKLNSTYAIYECEYCGTGFVDPLLADDRIYDAIYKNIDVIPGYSRYAILAKNILKKKDPLKYIMGIEDCYHGVGATIVRAFGNKKHSLIYEVGCGQGYLTYALASAGYNVVGLDISEKAIELARARYGDYFHVSDAMQYVKSTGVRPDCIFSCEVIEHLSDPVSFISEMLDCLAPNGILIITTPNKYLPSSSIAWDTELPPVHLWHFTRKGLAEISNKLSSKISFFNFTDFYREHSDYRPRVNLERSPRLSTLDEEYRVILGPQGRNDVKRLKTVFKKAIPEFILRRITRLRMKCSGYHVCDDNASHTLCVTFVKSARPC